MRRLRGWPGGAAAAAAALAGLLLAALLVATDAVATRVLLNLLLEVGRCRLTLSNPR